MTNLNFVVSPSGFSLDFFARPQVQGISTAACLQNRGTGHHVPSTGMRAHNPWLISWASSDLASLSPAPPTVPCSSDPTVVITFWTPGATVDPDLSSKCDQNDGAERWSASATQNYWFMVVGLPLLFAVLIAWSTGCFCYGRARRHRAKLERAAALELVRTGAPISAGDRESRLPAAGSEQPKGM